MYPFNGQLRTTETREKGNFWEREPKVGASSRVCQLLIRPNRAMTLHVTFDFLREPEKF